MPESNNSRALESFLERDHKILGRIHIAVPLILLPILLGGARPWIWPAVVAVFMLGLALRTWRLESTPCAPISRKWKIILGVLIAYPLFQAVPLSASWLALLTPQRLFWLQKAARVTDFPTFPASISYTPLTTVMGAFWWFFLLLFALALRKLLNDEARPTWLFTLLFFLSGFEAFYGVLQVLIPSLGVLWESPGSGLARGTFVNRNHYAAFLGMLWPLLLTYVWGMGKEAQNEIRQKQSFFGFIIGIMLLAIFFSQSRGGIIGSVISLTVLVVCSKSMRTKGMLALVIGAWTVMLTYGSIIGFDEIIKRFDRIEIDATGRFRIWSTTLRIIEDYPLTGTGLGSYGDLFPIYQDFLDDTQTTDYAHNDYLQLTADLGIPVAAMIFLLVWGFWWKKALSLRVREGGMRKPVREPHNLRRGRPERTEPLFSVTHLKSVGAAARSEPKTGIRRVRKPLVKRALTDERKRLLAVGALAGAAAFLVHGIAEFNWQIPANALYFVVLLVVMEQ